MPGANCGQSKTCGPFLFRVCLRARLIAAAGAIHATFHPGGDDCIVDASGFGARRRRMPIRHWPRGSMICGNPGRMRCVVRWPIAVQRNRACAAIIMKRLLVANGVLCRTTRCFSAATIRRDTRWFAGRRAQGFYVSFARRRVERYCDAVGEDAEVWKSKDPRTHLRLSGGRVAKSNFALGLYAPG